MTAKFQVGDKVRLNGRTPHWLSRRNYRRRARTIVKVVYHSELQANLYYLGDNNRAICTPAHLGFRSYQLKIASGKVGRPREKRRYTRHTIPNTKLPATSLNQQQSLETAELEESLRAITFDAFFVKPNFGRVYNE